MLGIAILMSSREWRRFTATWRRAPHGSERRAAIVATAEDSGFPRLLQLERREEQRTDEALAGTGRAVDIDGARARPGTGRGPRVWYSR